MKLYEISEKYLSALSALTDPESDIPSEVVSDTIEAVEGEFTEKAVNVAAFIRQMEAEADAIKEAETRMAARRRAIENRSEWLRGYLLAAMQSTGNRKISCPWFVVSIRKGTGSVRIDDEAEIPGIYKVIEERIDRKLIRESLKAGELVPGASLVEGESLSIR